MPDAGDLETKLLQLIQDAIKFEQTKKRRRMTPDGDLRPLSGPRIRQDVERIVGFIRNLKPAPRPTHRLKYLQNLYATLTSTSDIPPDIEQWAWIYMGAIEEGDVEALKCDHKLLVINLERSIASLIGSKEYELDKRGGRVSDFRLDTFLIHLAQIYKAYTGYPATYSEAPDGTGQQSPFFLFATTTIRHCFKGKPEESWISHDGSLQSAMKRISDSERHELVGPHQGGWLKKPLP